MSVLLQLFTTQPSIALLFSRYAGLGPMDTASWRAFMRAEQLQQPAGGGESARQIEEANALFLMRESTHVMVGGAVSLQLAEFALHLLSPQNDAVGPSQVIDMSKPLPHYWCACSYHSFVVRDIITGRSTSDVIRRRLLQGCRHIDLVCRDGNANQSWPTPSARQKTLAP
mmetsp:Transcript_72241/g.217132  ORF Transcript_72241/g.217132 Transcript_72241/m.217132 type:complete len:170 (-) Transcript_72241:140-649(-)